MTGKDNEEVTSFANFPGGKLGIDDFFVAVWKGPEDQRHLGCPVQG